MTERGWKHGLLAMPCIGVSLLPKLMCPLCWPAYAGLLSMLGLGFLISTVYLFPVTAVLLMLAAGSLAFRSSRRRGLRPFWLGLGAAVLVLVGKFYIESVVATYVGVILLVTASLWNIWPRHANAILCPACVPARGGSQDNDMRKGEMQL